MPGLNEAMKGVGIKHTASEIVGLLVFWLFMLTFLLSAAEALGLYNVSQTIDSFIAYLPNVIGGLAVGQLQVETTLINRVIEIGLLAIGAALAISLGLGTRDVARNVVAGVYARDSFKTGARVTVGGNQETLEAVTAVNARIRTDNGEHIYIPNAQLIDSVVYEKRDA